MEQTIFRTSNCVCKGQLYKIKSSDPVVNNLICKKNYGLTKNSKKSKTFKIVPSRMHVALSTLELLTIIVAICCS